MDAHTAERLRFGVPAAEYVLSGESPRILNIGLDSTGQACQPVLRRGSREWERFVVRILGASAIPDEPPEGDEQPKYTGALPVGGAGVVVFTNTRLIGVLVAGSWAGVGIDHARTGDTLVFHLPYETLSEISLMRKRKMLGGFKDQGIEVLVRDRCRLQLDIQATTTLKYETALVSNLEERFRELSSRVAEQLEESASTETQSLLEAVRSGKLNTDSTDGSIRAVLRRD
jgi:hypothetical protein